MTTEERLHALLSGVPAIASLVAARIYPVVAPLSTARPYVMVTRLNAQRVASLDALTGWARVRIQVSCWGDDATVARTVANAVRAALDAAATPEMPVLRVEAEADVYDDQADAVGRALDVTLMVQE